EPGRQTGSSSERTVLTETACSTISLWFSMSSVRSLASSASVAPRGRVPASGFVSIAPSLVESSSSGEGTTAVKSPKQIRNASTKGGCSAENSVTGSKSASYAWYRDTTSFLTSPAVNAATALRTASMYAGSGVPLMQAIGVGTPSRGRQTGLAER